MRARRERNDLDRALDDFVTGPPAVAASGLTPLLEAARGAREALAVEVPEEVAARHLAAMRAVMGSAAVATEGAEDAAAATQDAAAVTESAAVVALRRPHGAPRRRRALAIVLAAAMGMTLLSATAVAASANALPGETLYPVKRAAERLSLALQLDRPSKARLHLEFAERRLVELGELLAARRSGEDVNVGAAMRAYNDQVARVENDVASAALGRDFEALLAHVQEQLQKHVDTLTDLRDNRVPEQARDAIQNAIDRAETARSRAGHGRAQDAGSQEEHGKSDDKPGKGPSDAPGRQTTPPRD